MISNTGCNIMVCHWIMTLPMLLLFCMQPVQSNCPRECSTCLHNAIACENSRLLQIPTTLPRDTEKITLTHQISFEGVLTSQNFTKLGPPYYKITEISIRSSSIHTLTSRTFTPMRYLKVLDLSENQRLTIKSAAFQNLNLRLLKLDDIGKLLLNINCFNGLQVESLSMKNARLQTLEYQMFKPISNSLKKLFIENNQIRTINKKFETLFYALDVVSLKDNPLVCYCPLLWLSKVLKAKLSNHKYGRPSFSDVNINGNNHPKCVAPTSLRKKELHTIQEKDFNCYIPEIAQIDIDMVTVDRATMTCRIQNPTSNENKFTGRVYWQDNTLLLTQRKFSGSNNNKQMLPDTDANKVAVYRIDNYQKGVAKKLKCIAENTAGNSSITVHVSWLRRDRSKIDNVAQSPSSSSTLTPSFVIKNKKPYYSDLDDLEKTNKNNRNTNTNNNNNSESYLFQKQYTLLEMTSAVIGTFVLTVLIFLIFYRVCFRRRNGYKSGKKALQYSLHNEISRGSCHDNSGNKPKTFYPYNTNTTCHNNINTNTTTNNNNNNNINSTNNNNINIGCNKSSFGYDEGSSSHYSNNSQTYDSIPHNPIFPPINAPPAALFPPISNSPSAHFIDYKTHRNVYPTG